VVTFLRQVAERGDEAIAAAGEAFAPELRALTDHDLSRLAARSVDGVVGCRRSADRDRDRQGFRPLLRRASTSGRVVRAHEIDIGPFEFDGGIL
jgi:hypothetical protein